MIKKIMMIIAVFCIICFISSSCDFYNGLSASNPNNDESSSVNYKVSTSKAESYLNSYRFNFSSFELYSHEKDSSDEETFVYDYEKNFESYNEKGRVRFTFKRDYAGIWQVDKDTVSITRGTPEIHFENTWYSDLLNGCSIFYITDNGSKINVEEKFFNSSKSIIDDKILYYVEYYTIDKDEFSIENDKVYFRDREIKVINSTELDSPESSKIGGSIYYDTYEGDIPNDYIVIPDVIGLNYGQAIEKLDKIGFDVEREKETFSSGPFDSYEVENIKTYTHIDLPIGTKVSKGTMINIDAG